MKPRSLHVLPRTLVLCFSSVLAGASASAAVINFNEANNTNVWSIPAGTNVLAGATPTPATATNAGGASSSTSWATLTDGSLGASATPSTLVSPATNAEVVFALNLAGHPTGYDIASFDSFCVWNDNGRDNQNYTISYSTVSAPTTFITIAAVANNGGTGVRSTHTSLTDTTGHLATNVHSIKIHFDGQENSWVGYSEFKLIEAGATSINTVLESASTNVWTLPSGTNLLNGNTANTPSAPANFTHGGGATTSSSWSTLTDGSIGTATLANINPDRLTAVSPDNNTTVIFPLDLSSNFNGYNLSSIDTYCAWVDSGRNNQDLGIRYSTVANPTVFLPLANAVVHDSAPNMSTHVGITPSSGFLATNVAALQFSFADNQENGYVGYREFIALGTPVAVPTPLTWTGSSGSGGNANWIDGADNNWKTTAGGVPANYSSIPQLTFDSTGINPNITVTAPLTAATLTFTNDNTHPYTIGGAQVNVTAGIASSGNGTVTFNNAMQAASAVTQSGTGSLVFNGALTTSGVTLSAAGSVTVAAASTIPSAILSAGTLNVTTSALTIPSLSGTAGSIVLGNSVAPAASTLTTGDNGTNSYAGTLADASPTAIGNLTKTGSGNLTLSGTNTYTGITTISTGTLQLGSGTVDGSISDSSSITNNATLSYNIVGTKSYSGLISGTGNVTKLGAGTQSLANTANTYSGVTTLAAGTLNFATIADFGVPCSLGNRASDVATNVGLLFQGGTLKYTGSTPQSTNRGVRISTTGGGGIIDASGSVPTATLSFTAATSADFFENGGNRGLTFTGTNTGLNTFNMAINATGGTTSVAKSGAGTWVLGSVNSNYNGLTTLSGGILNVASLSNYGVNSSLGNRVADTAPGNVGLWFQGGTLQYTGSTAQSTNRAIRVSTNGGATIDASGSNSSATLSFTAASSPDFFENAGNRQMTLTGTNTGTNTFGMAIVETGGLTTLNKNGVGTWLLTGNNTYSGPTNINAGTLRIQASNGLGAGGFAVNPKTTIANGGALELVGDLTISEHFHMQGSGPGGLGAIRSISGNSSIVATIKPCLDAPTTIGVDADTFTIDAQVYAEGGNHTLTKTGAGGLVLSADNQNTAPGLQIGAIIVDAGTLTVSNGLAIPNVAAVTLANSPGALLNVNTSETIGSLAGGGASGGNVNIGSNTLTVGGEGVTLNSDSTNFDGVISGTGGSLVKNGIGTFTLNGINTYTGDTTVNDGILIVAANSPTTFADTSTVSIGTFAQLNLPNAGTDIVDNLIVDGNPLPNGVYDANSPETAGFITGLGKLQVVGASGYANWATSNVNGDAANIDTDFDGVSNGVEYFMNAAAGFTANPSIVSGAITWPNGGNIDSAAYGTEFMVQTSPDLVTWTNVLLSDPNLSNTAGSLTYTLPTGEIKIFVRLVVIPQ